MAHVGGLPYLKRYAEIKKNTFTKGAREYGVEPARGVLLLGLPGTGKSLTAKAIAGGTLPLLRMDVGALMGSLVGQSEGNTRAAFKVAEAVAPCVLWLDEIEKALGGSGGELDGGTSMRVLGTILTFMQETTAPIYFVATANDVRALRPEQPPSRPTPTPGTCASRLQVSPLTPGKLLSIAREGRRGRWAHSWLARSAGRLVSEV